tara:strand:+ start:500 stop:712 length:213 start_codon:yes stop_codon:yes gene_type:complete
MNNFKILKLTLIFTILLTGPSHAYLDPGTSGAFLATILGLLVAGWAYIKNKIFLTKEFFKKKFKKKDNKN